MTNIEIPEGVITIGNFKSQLETNATEINICNKDLQLQEDTTTLATGMQVELKVENETKNLTIVVQGDTNGDGKINLSDMIGMNRYRLKKSKNYKSNL